MTLISRIAELQKEMEEINELGGRLHGTFNKYADLKPMLKILGAFRLSDSSKFADIQYMIEEFDEILLFPDDNVDAPIGD